MSANASIMHHYTSHMHYNLKTESLTSIKWQHKNKHFTLLQQHCTTVQVTLKHSYQQLIKCWQTNDLQAAYTMEANQKIVNLHIIRTKKFQQLAIIINTKHALYIVTLICTLLEQNQVAMDKKSKTPWNKCQSFSDNSILYALILQESLAIAKTTARCALYIAALKIFESPSTPTTTFPRHF